MLFNQFTLACLIFSGAALANIKSDDKILNGTVLPTTNISYLWLFSQKLYVPGSQAAENNQKLKDATGFTLDIEIPVAKYLASGFYFEFYRGLQPVEAVTEDHDSAFMLSTLGYSSIGFGMFLKPKIEIPVSFGNLALSLHIPIGFELPVGIPLVPFITDKTPFSIPFSAYGLKTGISLGFEYFPIYILGFFVEAGYQVAYHKFLLSTQNNKGELQQIDGTFHYLIHGGAFMAGIKIAY